MLIAHRTLMGSEQPSFHQSRYSVTQRQEIAPHGTILAHDLMNVDEMLQPMVSFSVVCAHDAGGFNGLCGLQPQAPSRSVCDMWQLDSSNVLLILLCCNDYKCFFLRSTASFSQLLSTDIHLVNLDVAGEPVLPWPDHGPLRLIQPCPSSFIAVQFDNSLHSSRVSAVFLADHPPNGAKPQQKLFSGPFKDRSGNDRGLIVTTNIAYQPISRISPFFVAGARASETVRPTPIIKEKKQVCP
jgi:hypothetical protein